MAWFYPANAELFHAIGMAAFHRDILSPLLNLGWLVGCLFAAWCIGRPYGVAPLSLALAAVALSVPVLADQAGEARNDIVGNLLPARRGGDRPQRLAFALRSLASRQLPLRSPPWPGEWRRVPSSRFCPRQWFWWWGWR